MPEPLDHLLIPLLYQLSILNHLPHRMPLSIILNPLVTLFPQPHHLLLQLTNNLIPFIHLPPQILHYQLLSIVQLLELGLL